MKKLLFSLIAVLGLSTYALADGISVETVKVRQGKSGTMQLTLNTTSTSYRDFQFNLQLPQGITVQEIVDAEDETIITHGTTGDACSSKHTLASNYISKAEPQEIKYIVNTTTGNKLKTGVLANVTLIPNESLTIGQVLKGKITDFQITDESAAQTNFDDVTFNIEIVEDRIVFNETDENLPSYTDGEIANIRMTRTIKANEWSTLCLPFPLNPTNAKSIFGENAKFVQFDGVNAEFNEALEPTNITINFTTKTISTLKPLTAGTPVLVKSEKDVNTFELDNVKLTTATSNVEKGITIEGEVSTEFFGQFIGLFTQQNIPENGLFISGNKFYYSTGNTTAKAFRGYFMIDAILGQPIISEVKVDYTIDGVVTNIEGINNTVTLTNDAIYTLDGRRVNRTPQTKGVFIQNGKKVVK